MTGLSAQWQSYTPAFRFVYSGTYEGAVLAVADESGGLEFRYSRMESACSRQARARAYVQRRADTLFVRLYDPDMPAVYRAPKYPPDPSTMEMCPDVVVWGEWVLHLPSVSPRPRVVQVSHGWQKGPWSVSLTQAITP